MWITILHIKINTFTWTTLSTYNFKNGQHGFILLVVSMPWYVVFSFAYRFGLHAGVLTRCNIVNICTDIQFTPNYWLFLLSNTIWYIEIEVFFIFSGNRIFIKKICHYFMSKLLAMLSHSADMFIEWPSFLAIPLSICGVLFHQLASL